MTVEEVPSNEDEVVGTLHDITERKRAETELLRLNRALRVLSTCNQAGHAEQR